MNENDIKRIMKSSIWTVGGSEEHMSSFSGKFISRITDKTKIDYIINVYNWKNMFFDIINKIVDFSENNMITEVELKQAVDLDIHKMEVVDQEIIENSIDPELKPGNRSIISCASAVIKKGTTLYRYTDDKINHTYANPHPVTYGRFTDPNSEVNHSVIYLAFKKQVAENEVKGSKSDQLIKYKVRENIVVSIIPGALPSATQEDVFFVKRLRKFHNLLLSLQSSDDYFKDVNNKARVTKGIYITTNKVFEYLESNQNVGIIYPSTKVNRNSTLGHIDGDATFVPNDSNADIAIFNDIEKRDGKVCSKYLEALI